MKIAFVVPHPAQPHKLHVGVVEEGLTGILEVPVRKEHWESLRTDKARLRYLQEECCPYHHGTSADRARIRAMWEARDAEQAAALRAAERSADLEPEDRLTVEPLRLSADGKTVAVRISYRGHSCEAEIPADKRRLRANALKAWETSKAAADTLAEFALQLPDGG